jgi:hypothetical protein
VKLKGGITEKNGTRFAIVQVDSDTMHVPGRAIDTVEKLKAVFPKTNIVLMTRDKHQSPIFFGRPDIVNGLGDAALKDVQWQEYTIE